MLFQVTADGGEPPFVAGLEHAMRRRKPEAPPERERQDGANRQASGRRRQPSGGPEEGGTRDDEEGREGRQQEPQRPPRAERQIERVTEPDRHDEERGDRHDVPRPCDVARLLPPIERTRREPERPARRPGLASGASSRRIAWHWARSEPTGTSCPRGLHTRTEVESRTSRCSGPPRRRRPESNRPRRAPAVEVGPAPEDEADQKTRLE